MSRDRLRVVVAGMVAGQPGFGGASWTVLQYVLGLRRLGHDVVLLEPLPVAPDRRVLECFKSLVQRFDLTGRAGLLDQATGQVHGRGAAQALAAARESDLLLNVAGMLTEPSLLESLPARAYLDLDPAFVQLWHAQGIDMRFDGHTRFVTVGYGIGRDSPVPTCGRRWLHTLPPVVLAEWPRDRSRRRPAYTTVACWRGYGSVEHEGVLHGQKAHSLRPLMGLPDRAGTPFRLALSISPAERTDLEALDAHGWELLDPVAQAGTPDRYRSFVRRSWAEFGIAKSGYVLSRSGWFSDRSACYLASGRPVVAQATGFEQVLPTGEGLFAFHDEDDVLAATDQLRAAYPRHAAAARALADEHLDSDRVLPRLLERLA